MEDCRWRKMLLRSQRDALVPLIHRAGFEPEDFAWDRGLDANRPRPDGLLTPIELLRHKASGYFFTFSPDGCQWSPGKKDLVDSAPQRSDPEIIIGHYFREWLAWLRRELDTPNLWEELSSLKAIVPAGAESDQPDRPLTAEELRQFRTVLEEVRGIIDARRDLPEEQRQAMRDGVTRIEERTDAGKSEPLLTRRRLFEIVAEVIVAMFIKGAVDPAYWNWFLLQLRSAFTYAQQLSDAAVKAIGQ